MKTLTRAQSRQLDERATKEYGVASIVLMENAGRGVADVLFDLGARSPVVICCGKGNNAGDGFVIARHLDIRGIEARVLIWGEPSSLVGDARINYQILCAAGVPIIQCADAEPAGTAASHLSGATWIVDALLGTGTAGAPRSPLDSAIALMNRQTAPILAVDLPSGLDCDTGECPGAVIQAAHTCTFVAAKPGFLVDGVDQITGQLHVLDIGAPRRLVGEILGERRH